MLEEQIEEILKQDSFRITTQQLVDQILALLPQGDEEGLLTEEQAKKIVLEKHCSPETTARDIVITDTEWDLIRAQKLLDDIKHQKEKAVDVLEEMVWQFAYDGIKDNKLVLHTGGLSALKGAFEELGWDDPHFYKDTDGVTCDVKDCFKRGVTGGINWSETGYWLLCNEHSSSKRKQPKMKQRAVDRENSRDENTRELPREE